MYFNECKYCGATLDPGEKCDCQTAQEPEIKKSRNLLAQITARNKIN